MGLIPAGVEFLLWSQRHGVAFDKTMMLGRQSYIRVSPRDMTRVFLAQGLPLSEAEAKADLRAMGGYAEPLFERLGATEIRSMDASPFEAASDVHDLNEPIPSSLKARFSAVIDGGTLEHVFNFPQAIANALEMVELGGHLLLITPTNNEDGHGFYQFAPELFFRVLSPENGFSMERVLLKEHLDPHWYEVTDPAKLGRSQFRSRGTAYLYAVARRVELVRPFRRWPQQSDYASAWRSASRPDAEVGASRSGSATDRVLHRLNTTLRRLVPDPLLAQAQVLRKRGLYQHRPDQFRRVELEAHATE
jgi:hypothetical protein